MFTALGEAWEFDAAPQTRWHPLEVGGSDDVES